jgi:hypothetical protein
MQNNIWRNTLRNVAGHFGVDGQVEERIVCVDSHRQWSQAKNIWQNAIRSTLLHVRCAGQEAAAPALNRL